MATQPHEALTLLRRKEVQARSGRGKSSLYADIADGIFVPPVSIGARSVAWPSNEVDAILAARVAGEPEDAIRALVRRLVAARPAATSGVAA